MEDDDGDAFLVEDLLQEAAAAIELIRVTSLAEAVVALSADPVDCVLLDLGLPDADGISALRHVRDLRPGLAVIVLTGLADEHRGIEALGAGAQDYLVKGQVDGALLTRAIRYAIERRRAEESARQLHESELRATENARLERGLLPLPLLHDPGLGVVARYRPGRDRALLGGDFYDLVEGADGTVLALIGDVSGHGPDEAALGVCLRIAWRTLVLAGYDSGSILPAMQRVLVTERRTEEVFATVCMVLIDPQRARARVWLAGHPAPLLLRGVQASPVPDREVGPALGIVEDATWVDTVVDLTRDKALLLFTDGLIEGHVGAGPLRLDTQGLIEMIAGLPAASGTGEGQVDAVLAEVRRLNGGELLDDVAVVRLS